MTAFLAILRRHPVARAGAAWLFLFGFAGAATCPYLPVIAIRELGMTNAAYSAVIFAAAVANVAASVAIGFSRRPPRQLPPPAPRSPPPSAPPASPLVCLFPSAARLRPRPHRPPRRLGRLERPRSSPR